MPVPDRIRIAHCIDSFDIGGTELNAVRTIEALDRERFNITVFHLHEDGPIRTRYEALRVRMIHVPIAQLHSVKTAIQGVCVARLLRDERIRIVHTHDLYTNIFALPWARTLGRCRTIGSRRWLYEAPRPGLNTLNRWSYRFATRVLANSAAVARLLLDKERVPAHKIIEIPNFLEERAFRRVDEVEREARRREWGIPRGAFVVGVVARLVPVKNHAVLLRAAHQLDGAVHIVLIGDGPTRHALESLARDLDIADRVHFIGQLTLPVNLHQFFDVSVLCSRSEGFPNSVIEALAAGRPVIATRVGGITDVIVDEITGCLVAVDDPTELAERLRRLRADAELRRRLSSSGLSAVRSKYHESVVVRRLVELYERLAASSVHRGVLTQ